MSEEMKEMKKQLQAMVEPLVASLYKESISGKVVVSGVSLEARQFEMTPGPYWTVYNCIEHMTGVKTIPITLGRHWPSMNDEFAAVLQNMGNVIIIKERDRFAEEEVALIYETYMDQVKASFEEPIITDNPCAYFDACCKLFPGDVTTKMRQDFIKFQSKMALQGEVAGAEA